MVSEVKGARTAPSDDGVPINANEQSPSLAIEHSENAAKRTRFLVIVAYCVCCLVWSTTYYVVRQTVAPVAGNAPYFNAVVRFAMAVLIFIPVWLIFARKHRNPSIKEICWIGVAGILNGQSGLCLWFRTRNFRRTGGGPGRHHTADGGATGSADSHGACFWTHYCRIYSLFYRSGAGLSRSAASLSRASLRDHAYAGVLIFQCFSQRDAETHEHAIESYQICHHFSGYFHRADLDRQPVAWGTTIHSHST